MIGGKRYRKRLKKTWNKENPASAGLIFKVSHFYNTASTTMQLFNVASDCARFMFMHSRCVIGYVVNRVVRVLPFTFRITTK